jgi:hypothetical protein
MTRKKIAEKTKAAGGPTLRSRNRKTLADNKVSRSYGLPSKEVRVTKPKDVQDTKPRSVRKGVCNNPNCSRTEVSLLELISDVTANPSDRAKPGNGEQSTIRVLLSYATPVVFM